MNNSVNLPAWIVATQWASRGVLLLLIALSIWSVAIMVDRYRLLGEPKKTDDSQDLEQARKLIAARNWSGLRQWVSGALAASKDDARIRVPAGALQAALDINPQDHQASSEHIDRAVRSYLSLERTQMEKGLTTLATLGSNAPFIGLFGTVLGIIQAFGSLAAEASNTASVMTGISEALFATAVGLFVAIPAVVAYNVFNQRMRKLIIESESLRDYYLSRLGLTAGEKNGR